MKINPERLGFALLCLGSISMLMSLSFIVGGTVASGGYWNPPGWWFAWLIFSVVALMLPVPVMWVFEQD